MKQILAAVDGSESGRYALDQALEFARAAERTSRSRTCGMRHCLSADRPVLVATQPAARQRAA